MPFVLNLERRWRETRAFAHYLAQADLHRGWTMAGAKNGLSMLLDGRKDLYSFLPIHAGNQPDKPAIVQAGKVWTYHQLNSRAYSFGSGLFDRGVRRKDKVVVALGNSPEMLMSNAGAAHLGAVVVPVSTHYKEKELAHVVEHSDAKIVCLLPKQWRAIGGSATHTPEFLRGRTVALLGEREGDAIAWEDLAGASAPPRRAFRQRDADLMMYTSGTTGKPKGALLNTHKLSYARALQLVGTFGLTKHDRFFTACPAYHAAPTVFIGFVFGVGGTVYLEDKFDAALTWRYLDEAEITCAFMVPTQIVRLLSLPAAELARRPRKLTRLISGGAPLPAPVKQRALAALGPVVSDFYGATELGMVSMATPQALAAKPGTIGLPFPGVDVRFLDEQGQEVAAGSPGELFVSSNQFDFGYYKDKDATEKARRGGYRTVGDVGYRDDEGYLYLVDRKADLIISGGVNIYPAEIEQELLEHPAIEDAAVVGMTDAEWGESVCAFVVTKTGASLTAAEVVSFCAKRLSSMKKPRRVEFIAELPRSPQGKVQKRELRERLKNASRAP